MIYKIRQISKEYYLAIYLKHEGYISKNLQPILNLLKKMEPVLTLHINHLESHRYWLEDIKRLFDIIQLIFYDQFGQHFLRYEVNTKL